MTLTEKIEKIQKGLEGNVITGDARKALQKALETALKQQAEQAPPVEAKPVAAKKPSMRGGISSSAPFSLANWPLVKKMMPIHQQKVVKGYGEEREAILDDVEKMLSKIPALRNNKEQIVYARYYYGQSDWFILEYDKEDDRFRGFVILNGDSQMAELGYSSIEELRENGSIELDFYWDVKPLSQAKAEADPEMWGSTVSIENDITKDDKDTEIEPIVTPVVSEPSYVEQLIAAVKASDPRVSAYSEDGEKIEGSFRGKTSETYRFNVVSGSFDLNDAGKPVLDAFREALKKVGKPVEDTEMPEEEEEEVTPTILPSDCAVTRNAKQNGVEIRFPKQPAQDKIETLKRKGFRWSKFNKVWYAKYNEALYKWAIEFCNETAQTDNPADMTTVASPNERLITLAVLTKGGKVPQNLLKSEIEAGKLEVARFRSWDGIIDSNEYFKKEDYDWVDAKMNLDYSDIKRLKDGNVNTHWTDSISLNNDDGQIRLGDLTFRYKSDIKNADYNPKQEIENINSVKQIEREAAQESAKKVVDLSEDKFWIPWNRKAQRGSFSIENPLEPKDYIGKGKIDVVLEIDGYKLVGTAEAKNVVTGRMVSIFGGGAAQELRDDVFDFTAESGTVTPGFIGRFSKFKLMEIGDKTDFPNWKFRASPASLWEEMIYFSKDAASERAKMNEKGKTERGKKIHLGKMEAALAGLFAGKKMFLSYEENNPRLLQKVTGQSNEEYDKMLDYWRSDWGIKKPISETETNASGKTNTLREVVDASPNIMFVKPMVQEQIEAEKPQTIAPAATTETSNAKWQPDFIWTPNNTIIGKKRNINLPNGEKHDGQYAVVDLDTILASHNEETFADTPGYPRNSAGNNLNDRNYATDKAAQQLVEDYAQNLNPELLISTNSTPEGTPIINKDRIVVSGNNRTMSLKLAAKKYPEKYQEYRKFLVNELADFGIGEDVELMKNPVLVRIDYDFGELTTTNMAKYNASSMKAKSPVDKAAELATTLREQLLCETNIPQIIAEFDTLSDFYASAAAVRRMITAMQQCSVLNEQDMPAYVENGFFTNDGKTLLETILAALILEPDTLRIANRDGVKSLRQCIVNALAVLIANKNLPNQSSLIKYINEAIRYQGDIVSSGLSWENFVNQISIFDNEKVSCNAVYLNRLMNQGQKVFRNAIQAYNNSQSNAGESALFQSEVVTPEESFKGYIISRIPAEDTKRIEMYCGKNNTVVKSNTYDTKRWVDKFFIDEDTVAKSDTPASSASAPVQVASKSVLETRLKIINKMLEKNPSNTVLKTRLKIVTKMLA